MNRRDIAIAAAIVVLAVVMLIPTRTKYFLIPGGRQVLRQVGPFDTKEACEQARQQIAGSARLGKEEGEQYLASLICLASK